MARWHYTKSVQFATVVAFHCTEPRPLLILLQVIQHTYPLLQLLWWFSAISDFLHKATKKAAANDMTISCALQVRAMGRFVREDDRKTEDCRGRASGMQFKEEHT
jgi:hypothetical protein